MAPVMSDVDDQLRLEWSEVIGAKRYGIQQLQHFESVLRHEAAPQRRPPGPVELPGSVVPGAFDQLMMHPAESSLGNALDAPVVQMESHLVVGSRLVVQHKDHNTRFITLAELSHSIKGILVRDKLRFYTVMRPISKCLAEVSHKASGQ
jgi:hypothetical protein